MTTQELHEKRRKRTSLKKADQYRAKAEFYKQQYQALVKTLRGEKQAKEEIESNLANSKKSKAELSLELNRLKNYCEWLQGFWLVKIVTFFFKPKQNF